MLTCSFMGLGLIGGSIARAIREYLPDTKIKVYDSDISSLALALKEGIATSIYTEITEDLCHADYIFLCAPVSVNEQIVRSIKPFLQSHTMLSDVGSVKTGIHKVIESLDLEGQFIGGHPMAGSERFGFANSKSSLLENAYYIITPTAKVSEKNVSEFTSIVTSLKALPLVMEYENHDYVTAAISHLPHIIASSLVNLVKDSDSEDGYMKTVAAGGFKDITRIASSNAVMWEQICMTNSNNIKKLLSDYIHSLEEIKEQLDARDSCAIYDLFSESRIYRDSFSSTGAGPIKPSFTITVEIADRTGSLAEITVLMASESLNIKNLNIVHNREAEFGALSVEFYKESDMLKAIELLQKADFMTHLRKL
ncbi:MAG: prephenate dehydrogenase [Lachnospiraceae bacterium]